MNKKYLIILSVSALLFMGAGCTRSQIQPQDVGKLQQPAQTQNQPGASQPASAPAEYAQTSAVTINNFAFSPDNMTVKAGTAVTWTNDDNVPHQIVADAADQPDLKSDILYTGQTYNYIFNKAGTFGYHCQIHPSMKATITVQ
jgi:plastocyanin